MTLTLWHYLTVSALLLAAGVLTMTRRRNAIGIMMGVEIILCAAALNFVAFNTYLPAPLSGMPRLDGQIFALFIILVGAVQAAMAVAIFLNLRQHSPSLDVEKTGLRRPGPPKTQTPAA